MARFNARDKVRIKVDNRHLGIEKGCEGTVLDSHMDDVSLVLWDITSEDKKWYINDCDMELVYGHEEVDSNINTICDNLCDMARYSNNSWDDSVEFTPAELPKIDRFTFGYEDEYGMEITHRFNGTEFEYGLVDVIANFSLFLKGVGYTDEEIGEFINEGRM